MHSDIMSLHNDTVHNVHCVCYSVYKSSETVHSESASDKAMELKQDILFQELRAEAVMSLISLLDLCLS